VKFSSCFDETAVSASTSGLTFSLQALSSAKLAVYSYHNNTYGYMCQLTMQRVVTPTEVNDTIVFIC